MGDKGHKGASHYPVACIECQAPGWDNGIIAGINSHPCISAYVVVRVKYASSTQTISREGDKAVLVLVAVQTEVLETRSEVDPHPGLELITHIGGRINDVVTNTVILRYNTVGMILRVVAQPEKVGNIDGCPKVGADQDISASQGPDIISIVPEMQ